jgi:hypothetical protein
VVIKLIGSRGGGGAVVVLVRRVEVVLVGRVEEGGGERVVCGIQPSKKCVHSNI